MSALHCTARLLPVMLALVIPSVTHAQAAATKSALDTAVFVTRLGSDTLVIERVIRSPRRVEAEVAMRVPRTTRTMYVLELSPTGTLERMEAVTFDTTAGGAKPARRHVITRVGDSLRVESSPTEQTARAVAVATLAADANVLPFIDMVHWPYEIVLMRFRASGASEARQPLLTGSRVANFTFARVSGDSMTITHPTRGTMRLHVDAAGRLLALDAASRITAWNAFLDTERLFPMFGLPPRLQR